MSMTPEHWEGRTLAGAYQIRRIIGRGGMGVVFEAEHLGLGRTVAVKMLLDSEERAARRFREEALALGRLSHPNIVAVTDFRAEGTEPPFLVMEYLSGETLATLLGRERTLEVERAIAIALGILEGLEAAHAVGIVHRDLKPANVFVTRTSEVKLVDFGIAKREGAGVHTTTGNVLGAPSYLAPEQLTGAEGGVDARSDLHNVGVILFEMLTGQRPFSASGAKSVYQEILERVPPPVNALRPEVPRELSAIIAMALTKSKARGGCRARRRCEPSSRLGRLGRRAWAGSRPHQARQSSPARPRRSRRLEPRKQRSTTVAGNSAHDEVVTGSRANVPRGAHLRARARSCARSGRGRSRDGWGSPCGCSANGVDARDDGASFGRRRRKR